MARFRKNDFLKWTHLLTWNQYVTELSQVKDAP